ncbi:TIGR03087 family PEP-CTERM/XrtA system glycosyltransferase [Desulfoluna spongiiphila]|uniref:Sugar transferase, PEP-CTERM/EpsH1 system associated n=1 Tax=Desulfoluna spongiiphila TaxID=419481 RepID=A0A1G5BYX8_9BACT|nr:TIGR03087 family PEP-CTERM/XrtA system glycosyltransferase [Desulfoluna spongiiphila]SCX95277.1 sugar transferase, PEP-CTERM/EpsH1 system associated [Desulfoluna spongiiphila]
MSRVLYLAHRIPYPPNKGDKIRSYNTIRHLALNHEVDLICLADDRRDLKHRKELSALCRRVAVLPLNTFKAKVNGVCSFLKGATISERYFYRRRFQRIFNAWTRETPYDAVICFSSPMAQYLLEDDFVASKDGSMRLVMDFCDVDSDKWVQYAGKTKFPLNVLYKNEGLRLLRYEQKVHRMFDRSIFVSDHEASLFKALSKDEERIFVVPNGVDSDYFSEHERDVSQRSGKPMLMFAGAMDYYANVDGVRWFCHDILPEVRRGHPDIVFNIVGSNPLPTVTELSAMDDVHVTGFVKDIRPYYQEADVCVIPLRIARGVQNKVLEAMAMGKTVVTTPAAIQGIQVTHGKHVLVADSPKGFSETILSLMDDPERRVELGQAARACVQRDYSWNRNVSKLMDIALH